MTSNDFADFQDTSFFLERFLEAQEEIYPTVVEELTSGKKRTHWMWFVFPQLRGLGDSSSANHFGITGLPEATAYRRHRVLGPRLVECTEAVLPHAQSTRVEDIFGFPDCLKFRSCMTLFELVDGKQSVFSRAITQFYDGVRDEKTLRLLSPEA